MSEQSKAPDSRKVPKPRPIIRRQIENEEKPVCPARTRFVPPQAALNDNSEWKYIVNVQNKDVRFRQIIRVDVCE
ncbi:transposable element Tc1 transposase [Trichonephila clavipes]|nr:transposable element Tc1 transposase [Trichonephila clavipes]